MVARGEKEACGDEGGAELSKPRSRLGRGGFSGGFSSIPRTYRLPFTIAARGLFFSRTPSPRQGLIVWKKGISSSLKIEREMWWRVGNTYSEAS